MSCEGCPLFGNCPVNRIGEVMLTEDVIALDFKPNMEAAISDFNLLHLANSPNSESALAQRCSETLAERMIAYSFEEDQAEQNNIAAVDLVQQAIKHAEVNQTKHRITNEATIAPAKIATIAEQSPRQAQVKESYQKELELAIAPTLQGHQVAEIQMPIKKAQEATVIDEQIQSERRKTIVLEVEPELVQNTSQAASSIEKAPIIVKPVVKTPRLPAARKVTTNSRKSSQPTKTQEVITVQTKAAIAGDAETTSVMSESPAEHADRGIDNPAVKVTAYLPVEASEPTVPVDRPRQVIEEASNHASALDTREPIIRAEIEDFATIDLEMPADLDIYRSDQALVNYSETVDIYSEDLPEYVLPDIEVVVPTPLYAETVVVRTEEYVMPDIYLPPMPEPIEAVTVQEVAESVYYSSIFEEDSEPPETTVSQEVLKIETTPIFIAPELLTEIEQDSGAGMDIQEHAILAESNISVQDEPLKLIRQYDPIDNEPYFAPVELASPDDFWLEGEIIGSTGQSAKDTGAASASSALALVKYVIDSLISKPLVIS